MISKRHDFVNRDALARSLALRVAQALSAAVTRRGSAVLAVSGGTTPKLFFDHLSKTEISWDKVIVTLVDERDVPEANERSNARLVKAALMTNHASRAQFLPLYNNPDAAKVSAFDAVVLGMGNDGHTASFFPGGDRLAAALDLSSRESLITMNAPGAGEPRLTFTLQRLLAARFLALHIEGEEKARVLQDALAGDDQMQMPVRAILAAREPVELYWCP